MRSTAKAMKNAFACYVENHISLLIFLFATLNVFCTIYKYFYNHFMRISKDKDSPGPHIVGENILRHFFYILTANLPDSFIVDSDLCSRRILKCKYSRN